MGGRTSKEPSMSKRFNVKDSLNEKEYIFLVLQAEIDSNIKNKNKRELYHIEKEIDGQIMEIKSFTKYKQCEKDVMDRIQSLIYNYEISLAKVRSIVHSFSNNEAVKNSNAVADKGEAITKSVDDISSPVTSRQSPKSKAKINYKKNIELGKEKLSPHNEERRGNSSNLINLSDEDFEDEPTYVNVEDLDGGKREQTSLSKSDSFGPIKHKPPIATPRNKEEGLVKEIPNYFVRLNEILEGGNIDSKHIEEVLSIRRNTDEVRKVFQVKMGEIFKRYEKNTLNRQDEGKI